MIEVSTVQLTMCGLAQAEARLYDMNEWGWGSESIAGFRNYYFAFVVILPAYITPLTTHMFP